MAGKEGLEPSTARLTAGCSTIELLTNETKSTEYLHSLQVFSTTE